MPDARRRARSLDFASPRLRVPIDFPLHSCPRVGCVRHAGRVEGSLDRRLSRTAPDGLHLLTQRLAGAYAPLPGLAYPNAGNDPGGRQGPDGEPAPPTLGRVGAQGREQFVHRLGTCRGVRRQAAQQLAPYPRRHGAPLRRCANASPYGRFRDLLERLPLESALSVKCTVEGGAEGKDVGAFVDLHVTGVLLRSHVPRCPEECPGQGQPAVARKGHAREGPDEVRRPRRGRRAGRRPRGPQFARSGTRDAEVYDARTSVTAHQDVIELEVAVNHARAVGGC